MKKIINIAWKDLIIIFRDPASLLLMLGAPFLLTLGMGLVTGAFSDSDSSTGRSRTFNNTICVRG